MVEAEARLFDDLDTKVDHVACEECVIGGYDQTACGESISGMKVYAAGVAGILETPCAVCFYSSDIVCNRCGKTIDVAGAIA